MKKAITRSIVVIMMAVILAGCGENDDTVQNCIISNTSYIAKKDLETAAQPDTLQAGKKIFASIYFIESPKGMEYTVKWYLDGTKIKEETKATVNDKKDLIVYELEADKVSAGKLKLEAEYKDTVLLTKELEIK